MRNHSTNNNRQQVLIFDNLPEGILAISCTDPPMISNINAGACRILELQKEKVLGETVESVFEGKQAALLRIINQTLAKQRPIRNSNVDLRTAAGGNQTFLVDTVWFSEPQSGQQNIIVVLHDMSGLNQPQPFPFVPPFEKLIGNTASMQKVFSLIDTVAPTDAAVLIYGETGTGKELVARAIHRRSKRAQRPFIPVHCSALTDSLLESDLFGHVKGAFTGAIKDRPGRFEMADGGTIFLDEIATLSQEIQINLLRVLQEKTIERVGDVKSKKVDVRVLSATNRNLPDLIRQGIFRKDLYYRIKVIQINLPPLRKRKADISMLVRHFIERFNRQHDCNIIGVTREAMQLLKSYSWPGNVRELENAIEHAVIISKTNMIEPSSIPDEVSRADSSLLTAHPGQDTVSDAARIRKALSDTGGNVSRAAHKLGVHRTTLWRKMREFNISRQEQEA